MSTCAIAATLTAVFVMVVITLIVLSYKKAKKDGVPSLEDVVTNFAESEKETTIEAEPCICNDTCCTSEPVKVEDAPVIEPKEDVKEEVKEEAPATPSVVGDVIVIDEPVKKVRKTPLERAQSSIEDLTGKIERRTALLKKYKKPIRDDETLNKWKTKLKELKAAVKAIEKEAKAKEKKATKKK